VTDFDQITRTIEKLLTVKQAAQVLGLSVKTTQGYIHKGFLKAAKIGNSWRIRPEDLEDFTKRGTKPFVPRGGFGL